MSAFAVLAFRRGREPSKERRIGSELGGDRSRRPCRVSMRSGVRFMTPRLVLVCADEDLEEARGLYRRLKEGGFQPWMTSEDLLPGQVETTEVPNRIRDADAVLPCLSSRAAKRGGGLQKYLRLALSKLAETPPGEIRVIPVRLDDCESPAHALEELGIKLTDIHFADVFEQDGYAKLIKSLEHTGLAKGPPATVQPTGGYRAEFLEAFGVLCQGAENAFAANRRPAAKRLLESFRSWQESLDVALDDPALLKSLPQFLADREQDIADELLGHYFEGNPTGEVLGLINELARTAGPLVSLDDEDLREKLLTSVEEALAKIRSGSSGLSLADAKVAKRALLVIRGEATASRYNPKTLSEQRAALEGLEVRMVERPRLLTEAVLGEAFPHLPTGTVFRHLPELWCPQMVMIPKGRFLMGSPEVEEGRRDNEGPQHEVTISKAFALGRYVVTFDEYDHYCEVGGVEKPDDQGRGRGRRPATSVSHKYAIAYCAWLSDVTGCRYQLPTEAMWEYACRAGTTTAYSCGHRIAKEQAYFDQRGGPTPVGSYPANEWGLHEMHGNVWEWVSDWLGSYSADAVTDPQGADTGVLCVLRGGPWYILARDVRAASRSAHDPGSRYYSVGFRCAGIQGS